MDDNELVENAGDEVGKTTLPERVGRVIAYLLALPLLVVIVLLILAFIGIVVGGIGLLGWAIYHADPGELSPKEDAGYIDLIVSNRWVVWGLRAGLLAGVAMLLVLSIFVVISIVVRARRGEWLRSGAGLHTDIKAAERDIEGARVAFSLLAESQREKDELAQQLAETTDLLDWVLSQRAEEAEDEENPEEG